jgi:hypothetical protein
MARMLEHACVSPVLTAHPTEVQRKRGWTDSACKKVRFGSRTRCGTKTYVNLNYGDISLAG